MPEDDEDDDTLAGEMPELDTLSLPGDDPVAPPVAPAILLRYLSRQRALKVAAAAIRPLVPADIVEDLAADAVIRALKARPPRVEGAIPAWLAEIARRVAARWLAKRARRAKYEGPMPVTPSREDDYTGHALEQDAAPAEVESVFDTEVAEEAEALIDSHLES